MKKIKLVYNLLGKWGPANNAAEPDEDLLRFVNDNTYSTKVWSPSYLQNIVDFRNYSDTFELATPYSLNNGDAFIYEAPWNIFQGPSSLFTQMAENVLDGIVNGRGWIAVNDAVDPLESHRLIKMLDIMDQYKIPRHKIIFITGAIDISTIDNKWGVHIVKPDWNEIVLSTTAPAYENINNKELPKLNRFICLNNMWQHHRVHLLWKLYKNDLLKHVDISFKKTEPNTHRTFPEKLIEVTAGFFSDSELVDINEDADNIDRLLPLQVDDLSKLDKHLSHSYLPEHTRYNFYIVPETTFYNFEHKEFLGIHASEKVFKPMLYKMPFIVLGPKGVLAALHKKGYKTFGSLINESYDTIDNEQERFAAIIDLIKDLSNQSQEDIDNISKLSEEITEHNYKNLIARKELATVDFINSLIDIVNK